MRHIDDGFSYEFYEYEKDIIDYYRKKSDYDANESEKNYLEMRIGLLDGECNDMTFSFGNF